MAVAYLETSLSTARRLPGPVGLRTRAADDAADLFELFNEPGFLEHALMREPFANVDELARWMNRFASVRRAELVATVEGRCVGFGAVYAQGEHFSHSGALVLGVREAYQRRGAGGLLVRALIVAARMAMRLNKLQLTVICENAAAVRLYRNNGFQIEGLHRRFAKRGERYLDAYSMAILLDPPAASRAASA